MSYLLFLDESGQDQHESPYEVLAGVCVEDRDLWNLICAIHDAETDCFGTRYADFHPAREWKSRELLKRKTFRIAALRAPFDDIARRDLAHRCLMAGAGAPIEQYAALGQAKIAFAERMLEAAARFRCKAFASIIPRDAPRAEGDFLRKDYAYLFERYFYFLEDQGADTLGIVVFDELERSQSHILVEQMRQYFLQTQTGRMRAGRVIPQPFFVHSDLTTGIQLADLVAYLIAWGVQVGGMPDPARDELGGLGNLACSLRHRSVRELHGNPQFSIWSFALIDDLRSRHERAAE